MPSKTLCVAAQQSAWHRPKSQVHDLTLLWSSVDGGSFCLRLGLLTRNGCGELDLEQIPEVIAALRQPQVLIWAAAFSLTPPKYASVPVQSLQIQQPLRQCAVPRLMHP